jgi:hypothetical protein
MFQKKFIALVCVIAILGIGACFLPPEHFPPPPLPPYLARVSTFAIHVQDASGNDNFNEGPMSQAVTSNFNQLWKEYAVRAKPFQTTGSNDATLRITVIRKSATSSRTNERKQRWDLELITSSTLTAPDGRLLWQEQNENSHSVVWLENDWPTDGWNSRLVMRQTAYSLAMSVGGKILNSTH